MSPEPRSSDFIPHSPGNGSCAGAMGFTNEGVRKAIKERLGPEAGAAAEDIDFGAFKVSAENRLHKSSLPMIY